MHPTTWKVWLTNLPTNTSVFTDCLKAGGIETKDNYLGRHGRKKVKNHCTQITKCTIFLKISASETSQLVHYHQDLLWHWSWKGTVL